MTVAELIKKLQEFPQEREVCFTGPNTILTHRIEDVVRAEIVYADVGMGLRPRRVSNWYDAPETRETAVVISGF